MVNLKDLKVDFVSVCGATYLLFEDSNYIVPYPIKYFPPPFVPKIPHDFNSCPQCKNLHEQSLHAMLEIKKSFPNCCDDHRNLYKNKLFNILDFLNTDSITADKIFITFQHILNYFLEENWEVEIKDYLDYVFYSLGSFPTGYGGILHIDVFNKCLLLSIENKLKNYKSTEKYSIIKDYIVNWHNIKSNELNIEKFKKQALFYDTWLSNPVFNLPLLSSFKNKHSKLTVIMTSSPTFNKYTGKYHLKIADLDSVKFLLFSLTKDLLCTIDSTIIYNKEFIKINPNYEHHLTLTNHYNKQKKLLTKGVDKSYYSTINKWIINELDLLSTLKKKGVFKTKTTSNPLHSFKYINYITSPSKLTDFYNSLKKDGFIQNDTKLTDFKKVFSGSSINTKVIWHGSLIELSFLIKQLHNEIKKIEDTKQQIWYITINCFEMSDGSVLNNDKLRLQTSQPAKSLKIMSAINLL